jgi:hypothetical protein
MFIYLCLSMFIYVYLCLSTVSTRWMEIWFHDLHSRAAKWPASQDFVEAVAHRSPKSWSYGSSEGIWPKFQHFCGEMWAMAIIIAAPPCTKNYIHGIYLCSNCGERPSVSNCLHCPPSLHTYSRSPGPNGQRVSPQQLYEFTAHNKCVSVYI